MLVILTFQPVKELAWVAQWATEKGHQLGLYPPGVEELAGVPQLFNIDLLVLNQEQETSAEWLQEARRAGRPIVILEGLSPAEALEKLEAAAKLPRSNYQPIDCNYYDYFEAAIVQKRVVQLRYRQPDGSERKESVKLQDLKTAQSEEFVQLTDGRWLRLDRIRELDGVINDGEFCRLNPEVSKS